MQRAWKIAIGAALGLGAAAGLGVTWRMLRPLPLTRADWDAHFVKMGAPAELAELAAAQRFTESRDNPKTGLGVPSMFPWGTTPRTDADPDDQLHEAAAAATAYDRNASAMAASPYPRKLWIFGSGGAYGAIPVNAISPFFGSAALRGGDIGPRTVFDPWPASVLFAATVKRIKNSPQFRALPESEQTYKAIKRGLASMELVSDWQETTSRAQKIAGTLRDLSRLTTEPRFKISSALADTRVPDLDDLRSPLELIA